MKRWWIFWILAAAFVWPIVSSFAEIKGIVELLIKGNLLWILAATLLLGVFQPALLLRMLNYCR